jgi:plastocyanin
MRSAFGLRGMLGMLVALGVLGSACAKSGVTTAGGSPTGVSPSPSSVASASTGGSGGGDYGYGSRYGNSSSSSSTGANTVQQGAGGFVFSPTKLTVSKGTKLTITNVGTAQHTFTIQSKGIDVVNDPGQSQTVTINLAPGTYTFICRFHVSLGMKGTITVTG